MPIARDAGMSSQSGRTIFVREPPALHAFAAKWIRGVINTATDTCHIALAGGTTPAPVYELLAQPPLRDQINWDKVAIWFGDERAVPPDAPESNYRSAREALLDRVPIPPERVHRMEADREDLDAAARDYEQQLPPVLNLLILGLGAEGHTASIFPGSPAWQERDRRVVAVTDSPKPPARRLTITVPVIESAQAIVVVARGAEKAAVIARTLEGPRDPRELPIQYARRGAWFLDRAAASLLKNTIQ